MVTLAASNVSKDIRSYVGQQITVAQMMSKGPFLWEWLSQEPETYNESSVQPLLNYLKIYQRKYYYSAVFLVSDKSRIYYFQDGLNKIISPHAPIDSWYYNFLNLNREYDLQLDRSETDDNAVSLFVNCRIIDNEGNFLGVISSNPKIDKTHEQLLRCC